MGEVSKSEISTTKLLVFIGMLFTVSLGITYFYEYSLFNPLFILWGIICLVIAFLLFVILEIISFGAFKIPSQWWILLIFGVVLFIISLFFGVSSYIPGIYFPAILIIMAAIIQLLTEKKTYMTSKMVAIVGAGFAAWDCIGLFFTFDPLYIINAIIGLILIVILFLIIFDIKFWIFDYSWWFILLIGFVIFTWISPFATFLPLVGYGGMIILIAFVLVVMSL